MYTCAHLVISLPYSPCRCICGYINAMTTVQARNNSTTHTQQLCLHALVALQARCRTGCSRRLQRSAMWKHGRQPPGPQPTERKRLPLQLQPCQVAVQLAWLLQLLACDEQQQKQHHAASF
jgi:hypothetical protein